MERAVEKADFGEGPRTIIPSNSGGEKGAHFATSVDFFTVKCGDKEFKVVGKIQLNEFARAMMRSDLQFATEVLMYKEMIPFFGLEDLFPKMYYGRAEGKAEEDVILLEDLRPYGYRISEQKIFLSIDHLRLAVKALGRFHAASLTAKSKNRKVFDELVSRLLYEPSDPEPGDTSMKQCMERGIKPHLDKHGDILRQALQAMEYRSFLNLVTKPVEPWAVVCHGDFCRNNMLFKYDGNNPVSVKFFDLQTSRYTSPAIDLSFFLYLNTDKVTRDLHWDSLIADYLHSLKSNLPSTVTIDEQGFYDNFASRAVYGYLHCSFFTPVMNEEITMDMDEFSKLSLDERTERLVTTGGEKGTQLIADIVAHLLEKGYIHKFVELANRNK